ncbi:MFS general substrate transporter [Mycena belliarum]|uniref:MFS general substrate transporter n=1 Tax=Mycena belliarum TaxID=1033014 RepID=A0AAD6XI84_9AGAR|nr:MFS general substrate transporter [Mycena belliae]
MSSTTIAEAEKVTPSGQTTPRGNEVQLTDQTNRLPFRKLLPIFLGLAVCAALASLDSVIVATALPTISSAFNAGSVVSWVPSAYLLTSTCFQPLYGRFSDIFGRKSALALAMALFMLGNLISGFAKTIGQLIVFRGIAGAGGGGVQSMMQIVVSDIVTLRERGKYQGIIGGIIAVGYAIGPPLGGALAQNVGWQWCVWITIPFSLVATCIVIFVLPLKPVQGNIRSKLLAVDYLGALLTLLGCTLFILPLIWGGVTFPWSSAVVLAPLVSSAAVVVLFCCWEWKGARLPIVPMYIFRHATVTGVFISMFVNGFVFFSTLYYLPQFFQVALGYDSLHAGLFLIPFLVVQSIASWLAGMLVSRTGRYRTIIQLGFGIWAIACGCISTIRPGSPKALLVVYMILAGSGSGQTMQTTTIAVQASVSRRDMSVVTAMRNFIRLLGGTLSLAVASTLVNNKLRSAMIALDFAPADIARIIDDPALLHTPARVGLSEATAAAVLLRGYTKGFSALFIMNACMTVLATVVSVVLIKHKELGRQEEEARLAAVAAMEKGATPTESGIRDLEAGAIIASRGVEPVPTLAKEPQKDSAM